MYAYLKQTEASFSHRKFAERAGLGAPNNLKRVMEGERNLTLESVRRFAKGLGLSPAESRYRADLVAWQHADDADTRKELERRLQVGRSRRGVRSLGVDTFDVLAHWYVVAIRELVGVDGLNNDPAAIAKLLKPRVGVQDVRDALELLLRLGLIVDDNGVLQQADRILSTADEVQSLAARSYHREMIGLAQHALDDLPRDERVVGGVTASVGPRRWAQLRDLMHRQRQEMLAFLTAEDGEAANRGVQVNYQAFPLSEAVAPVEDEA